VVEQSESKLNQIGQLLPEGLLVDSAWLTRHGFYGSLRTHYVATGWLEQPARRVYRRPRGELTWQQVVVSLQGLLACPLAVGGRTALELQGYAHYLSQEVRPIHLYGPERPPSWLEKLPLPERFCYHNSARLFSQLGFPSSFQGRKLPADFTSLPWGPWEWRLVLSAPERALLEMLNELPEHESFEQTDRLMEGLANLRPRLLQTLLEACSSVKVKRLFFFFADHHHHAWLNRLDKDSIDLGTGKRMLVRGGKLDPVYQITVPEEFYGVQ
jgi:hypothetical protein